VRMLHLGKVASEYDAEEALAEMREILARFGVSDRTQLHETYHSWFAWSRIRSARQGAERRE
jgi:hypothetical protein